VSLMFDHDITLFDEPVTPQEREKFKWRMSNRELPYAHGGQIFGKAQVWSDKEWAYVHYMREAYSVYKHMGGFGYGVARIKDHRGLQCELPHASPRPIANFTLYGAKQVMMALCEQCLIDLLRCFGAKISVNGALTVRRKGEPMLVDDSKEWRKEERARKKRWKAEKAAEEIEKMLESDEPY
jgi:hypothetical protein